MNTLMLKHALFAATLLLTVGQSQLQAHNLPVSEMMLVADDEYLHMEIVLNATELTFFREMDRDRNGHVSLAEAKERDEQVSRRIVDCFEIRVDGQIVEADVAGLVPNHNTHHLTIRAHYPADAAEAAVELTSRLAAITHGAHLVQVVYRTPHETRKARLNASADSVLFPAPAAGHSTGLETPTTKTTAKSPGAPSWWKRIGVAVGASLLLGCFVLFYKKNR
jgi:hypothetical protein